MIKDPTPRVAKALAVTTEICGYTFSEAAIQIVGSELARYPEDAVLRALTRCVREVKGRLTLADIIERLDDGRPTADEAWAMVGTNDEGRSIVATSEAMEAMEVARLMLADDHVAARMAFKNRYTTLVTDARAKGVPVRWLASLGHDQAGRASALAAAVQQGRLDPTQAAGLLGDGGKPLPTTGPGLPAVEMIKALAEGRPPPEMPEPSPAAEAVALARPLECAAAWCDGQWHYSQDPDLVRRPLVSRCTRRDD